MLVVVLLLLQPLLPLVLLLQPTPSPVVSNASDYGVPASRRDA
jgi:hypothetical protein